MGNASGARLDASIFQATIYIRADSENDSGVRLDPAIRRAAIFFSAIAKKCGLKFRLDDISRPSMKAIRDAATPDYIERFKEPISAVGSKLIELYLLHLRNLDPEPFLIRIRGRAASVDIEFPGIVLAPYEEPKAVGRPAASSADDYEQQQTIKALREREEPSPLVWTADEANSMSACDAWKCALELVFSPHGETAKHWREVLTKEQGDKIQYCFNKAISATRKRLYSYQGIIERNIGSKSAGDHTRIRPAEHNQEISGGALFLALATNPKPDEMKTLVTCLDNFTKAWSAADKREQGRYGKITDGEPAHNAKPPIELDALPGGTNRLGIKSTPDGEQRGYIEGSKSLRILHPNA